MIVGNTFIILGCSWCDVCVCVCVAHRSGSIESEWSRASDRSGTDVPGQPLRVQHRLAGASAG